MKPEQTNSPYETGRKVWGSLLDQMAEGSGFLSAMLDTFRHFIRKYILSFLLFGILAGAAGAGYWLLKPKVYEASMTVSYVHYEKKIYADMLDKLNQMLQAGSYAELSSILGLPADTIKKVVSIEGFNIRMEPLVKELSADKIPFYVVVMVRDLGVLKPLQKALVNYMNGTDFIRDRLNYMKQKSEEELAFLQHRLTVVDSLSNFLIIQPQGLNNEKTISRMDLLQEAMTLHSKIQEVQGSLKFNKNIEVLDGFAGVNRKTGKGMINWIIYGFLGGLFLRFLLIIFK